MPRGIWPHATVMSEAGNKGHFYLKCISYKLQLTDAIFQHLLESVYSNDYIPMMMEICTHRA